MGEEGQLPFVLLHYNLILLLQPDSGDALKCEGVDDCDSLKNRYICYVLFYILSSCAQGDDLTGFFAQAGACT